MDPEEVSSFLTHLAVQEKVSSSTQNQAFSAILFLYRHVSYHGWRSGYYSAPDDSDKRWDCRGVGRGSFRGGDTQNIPPEKGRIELHAANSAYAPLVFEGKDMARVSIVGKLAGVIRRVG